MDMVAEFHHYYGSPRGTSWLEFVECLTRIKRFDARAVLAALDGARMAIGATIGGQALEVSIERDRLEGEARGGPTEPVFVLKQSKD